MSVWKQLLAYRHIIRFQQAGDRRALEAGIAAYRKLAGRNPDPLVLANLGNALSMRYDELKQEPDLAEAIGLHRRAVAAMAGQPGLANMQAQLAAVLANHKDAAQHRTEARELFEAALRGQLQDRPLVLANYGMFLRDGYMLAGDRSYLVNAADALRASAAGTDPASLTHLLRMAKLGSVLIPLASAPPYAAELEAIVQTVRERYDMAPGPVKREIQLHLGIALTVDVQDIPPEAWELFEGPQEQQQFRTIVSEYSGPGGRSRYLAMRAGTLIEDARQSGRLDRADQAVEVARQAIADTERGSPEMSSRYLLLGSVLGLRIELSGTTGDLDEMVDALRRGVKLASPDDDSRGMYRSDLGNALMLKFKQGGGHPADLEEAIVSYQRALAESPEHPERARAYTGWGSAAFARFELTGHLPDLDLAVYSHRAAVSLTSRDQVDYALYLGNLGGALALRYSATRSDTDIEEAAAALRKAVSATPEASPYRPLYLANLGTVLAERHRFTGQADSLQEAIGHLREARRTVQPGNIQRAVILTSLGTGLTLAEVEDEAIEAFRAARSAAPAKSVTHTMATANLAGQLLSRASSAAEDSALSQAIADMLSLLPGRPNGRRRLREQLPRGLKPGKAAPDLEESIALLREAVRANNSVSRRAHALLGRALQIRYRLTGNPRALTMALETLRAAVTDGSPHDPESSVTRFWLASILTDQWKMAGEGPARDEAIHWFREAAEVTVASPDWRATVGQRWGEFAMDEGLTAEAADGFATAIGALDEAAWRGLGRTDQERVLRDYEGLARDGAAVAIRAGNAEHALELLEQGRGVLLGQVLDSRMPSDVLRESAPELANRLAEVEDALDNAERLELHIGMDLSPAQHEIGESPSGDLRYSLARQRREILDEIRRLPGFADFLLPPRCTSLLKAAEAGPVVVVNVSRYGCDAIIVTTGGLRILPLNFTASDAERRARHLADAVHANPVHEIGSCLDWLWENVTGPVLEALGPVNRTWWCPTGPLTLLPLHAAGPALDRVVSSYTPTLRSLLQARSHHRPATERRFLLVGAADARGQVPLTGVRRELDAVRSQLPEADELLESDATRDRVLSALEDSAWVHFACHATQEIGDPSRSRLLLDDGPVTIRDLAARRLDNAEFAFLSGCETSRGGDVLTDEAISIAATVQLAGFPHVIGTLWPASDVHAPAIARDVYAALTAGGTHKPHPRAAAYALHKAVRSLRERRPDFPVFWAPYVHFGP